MTGMDQKGEQNGYYGHERLKVNDQLAPVHPVAQDAGPRAEEHDGQGADAAHGYYQKSGRAGGLGKIADQPTYA